jgi:hypothetical protein
MNIRYVNGFCIALFHFISNNLCVISEICCDEKFIEDNLSQILFCDKFSHGLCAQSTTGLHFQTQIVSQYLISVGHFIDCQFTITGDALIGLKTLCQSGQTLI